MGRMIKVAGAMLGALLVLALSAAAASANLPILLNINGELVTAETFTANQTVTTKLSVLEENTSVSCKKLISTAELKELEVLVGTEKQFGYLGPFHIEFKECEAIISGVNAGKCTGLGDTTTGLILVLGEAHGVFDSLSELGAAVLFLLPTAGVHFECKSVITVLEVVLGSVLCLIKPINSLATTAFEVDCEGTGTAGDQKELKYSSGKLPLALDSTAGLFAAKNEGTEKDSAQEGVVNLTSALAIKVDA